MDQRPPKAFYRVQHADSFTQYEAGHGFEAQAEYTMEFSHWVNKQKFESHLDWNARPLEATPYISLFDNEADAIERAEFHINKGCDEVLIARIEAGKLSREDWTIYFGNQVVVLPIWRTEEGHEFIATSAVRQHLGVDVRISQASEWFAVNHIPCSMIKIIWRS